MDAEVEQRREQLSRGWGEGAVATFSQEAEIYYSLSPCGRGLGRGVYLNRLRRCSKAMKPLLAFQGSPQAIQQPPSPYPLPEGEGYIKVLPHGERGCYGGAHGYPI